MCTVTFLPRQRGYALAMNRDEQRARMAGLPPSKKIIGGRAVLAPSEPGGGTWIAVNESGATLALINWYSVANRVSGETISRGQVVQRAAAASAPERVASALAQLSLERMNPFRLIGIFSDTREIAEWRWDLKKLVRRRHRWQAQQWISSGFNESAAQRVRHQTFRRALEQTSAGSLDWLRRLHRSHSPQMGPFSTCMHRADAATVSYTEVTVSPKQNTMRHRAVSPCQCVDNSVDFLRRRQRVPTI